jgi:hypothetical protein
LGLSEEEIRTGITKRETKTAKRGLIEMMVSIYWFAFFIKSLIHLHFRKGRIIVFTIVPE